MDKAVIRTGLLPEEYQNSFYRVGHAEMIGRRQTMEDACTVQVLNPSDNFASTRTQDIVLRSVFLAGPLFGADLCLCAWDTSWVFCVSLLGTALLSGCGE